MAYLRGSGLSEKGHTVDALEAPPIMIRRYKLLRANVTYYRAIPPNGWKITRLSVATPADLPRKRLSASMRID